MLEGAENLGSARDAKKPSPQHPLKGEAGKEGKKDLFEEIEEVFKGEESKANISCEAGFPGGDDQQPVSQ